MEILEIRRQLTNKFGQKFALSAHNNKNGEIDIEFINKIEPFQVQVSQIMDLFMNFAKENLLKFGNYDPTEDIRRKKEEEDNLKELEKLRKVINKTQITTEQHIIKPVEYYFFLTQEKMERIKYLKINLKRYFKNHQFLKMILLMKT